MEGLVCSGFAEEEGLNLVPEEWEALVYGEGKAHQENSLKQGGALLLSG